jgi:hypothetical protein
MKIGVGSLAAQGSQVTVRTVRKRAPCGDCGGVVLRDDMWAVNIMVAAPNDGPKRRIRIRMCEECCRHLTEAHSAMEWDNSSMVVDE